MNQPEGYVLVQIKQLAQWREWANNVAAWSKQADRSSEVARLKASISSAMISATLPPASAAGEMEDDWSVEAAAMKLAEVMDYPWLNMPDEGRMRMRRKADAVVRAALATKPQAVQEATPPAQTVQDDEDWRDKEISRLRTLLEINEAQHSHECRRCGFRYTPDEDEDCPKCGFDGGAPARTRGDEVGKS